MPTIKQTLSNFMSNDQSLKNLLRSWILLEATRFKKETGQDLSRPHQKLLKYEEAGGYFVHFSSVPRMGLFIRNKYHTPIGFYAYPLDRKRISPFGTERPYALVIRPKPEARILDLQIYTDADLGQDLQKLLMLVPSIHTKGDIEWAVKYAKDKRPGGKLWAATRFLSGAHKADEYLDKVSQDEDTRLPLKGGGPTGKWTMLLKKLGYDGVVDPGFGIIHHQEPSQAVFFDTTKLELVEVIQRKEQDDSPGASALFKPTRIILSKKNLSGKNLSGKNFAGAALYNTQLNGANLTGVNFEGATFRMTNLEEANLTNANLSGLNTKILETNLARANLAGASLAGSNIQDSVFDRTNLQGADFTKTFLRTSSFRYANLRGANMSGAFIYEVDFYKATYDSKTIFPELGAFDPKDYEMILVED